MFSFPISMIRHPKAVLSDWCRYRLFWFQDALAEEEDYDPGRRMAWLHKSALAAASSSTTPARFRIAAAGITDP